MDPSILIKLTVLAVAFVGVLRVGVFAWEKLKNNLGAQANHLLAVVTLCSMAVLLPFVDLTSLFDPQVFPRFFVLHICGGTLVCSVIAKWVEDVARKDIAREQASQQGE